MELIDETKTEKIAKRGIATKGYWFLDKEGCPIYNFKMLYRDFEHMDSYKHEHALCNPDTCKTCEEDRKHTADMRKFNPDFLHDSRGINIWNS